MNPSIISERDVEWIGMKFLDPIGRTFYYKNSYYKAVYPDKISEAKQLIKSKAFSMLHEAGFVDMIFESTLTMEKYPIILKLDTEYFSINHSDWGHLIIKEAAIAYCDINILLNKYGKGLSDGHKANFIIQRNSSPRWCDIGSFVNASEDSLFGIDEFIKYFVYPLLIRAKSPHFDNLMHYFFTNGCSHDEAILLLGGQLGFHTLSRLKIFQQLRDIIKDISFKYKDTTWGNYHDKHTPLVADEYLLNENEQRHSRIEVIKRLIKAFRPKHVIDFGANAGYFSIFSAASGAEVIAYELDEQAAAKCHLNFRNCPPTFRTKIAQSGLKPHGHRQADLVLALALTHHLFFTHHYSFEAIARILAESTSKHLITEYMPHGLGVGKPHIDPLPAGYALPTFLNELSNHFSTVHCIDYVKYKHRKLIVASK